MYVHSRLRASGYCHRHLVVDVDIVAQRHGVHDGPFRSRRRFSNRRLIFRPHCGRSTNIQKRPSDQIQLVFLFMHIEVLQQLNTAALTAVVDRYPRGMTPGVHIFRIRSCSEKKAVWCVSSVSIFLTCYANSGPIRVARRVRFHVQRAVISNKPNGLSCVTSHMQIPQWCSNCV